MRHFSNPENARLAGQQPKPSTWTDDEIATIKRLWQEGLSAAQIAGRLTDRTRNSVIGIIHRKGLNGRVPKPRIERPRPQKREPTLPALPAEIQLKPIDDSVTFSARQAMASTLMRRTRARTMERPKQMPIEAPPQPRGDRPGLMQLKSKDCRWPYGDPRDLDGFHFCGAPIAGDHIETTPYCIGHARMAVTKAPLRE